MKYTKPVTGLLVALFLVSLCVGCSTQTTSGARPSTQVIIDSSLSEEALPAWVYYAASRSLWVEKRYWERNPSATHYEHTFEEEIAARKACAAVWKHTRQAPDAKPDAYLDQLVAVADAGYVPEYTWTYFRDPRWKAPPELRIAEFDAWRKINLRDHRPETRAVIELIPR